MSHENEVFADLLFELGFEESNEAGFKVGAYRFFDRIFEGFSRVGKHSSTSLEIKLYETYVTIQWVTDWIRPAGGYPTYSYPIPKEWPDAAQRLAQLIRLAEVAADTGKILPVAYDFSIPQQYA